MVCIKMLKILEQFFFLCSCTKFVYDGDRLASGADVTFLKAEEGSEIKFLFPGTDLGEVGK